MTIDEFMRDIAPKMRPGWVAMDESESWFWYLDKPEIEDEGYYPINLCYSSLEMFDIAPVDDWTQSLRKVGCNE